MAADNNDGKKIQLNRKMRLWNKYKNPIIGAVSVIVIVIAAVVVLKAWCWKTGWQWKTG